MTMHGAPGGPTSSGLYDAATDAFRRWRDDDEAALDDLVRVMSPVLWHVVRATGLDSEAAEDVVQNTWLTLVRSADSVRDPQAITRWLCTAARREAWRVSKASTRTRPVEDEVLDARMPAADLARVRGRHRRRERPRCGTPSAGCRSAARSCSGSWRGSRGPTTPRSPTPSRCRSAASARRAAAASTSSASSSEARHEPDPTTSSSTPIAVLYADLDPAPADLADGVLARLAVEDLETEYELLTLVESVDTRVGTRQRRGRPETTRRSRSSSPARRTACWCGSAPSTAGRRLDGWVVPALPMRVFLGPPGDAPGPHPAERVRRPRRPLRVPRPDARRGPAVAAAPGRPRRRRCAPPFVTPRSCV